MFGLRVGADSGIGAERGCGGGHHGHLTGSVLVGARDVAGGLQQDAMPHRGGPDVPLDAGTKPVEVRAQHRVRGVQAPGVGERPGPSRPGREPRRSRRGQQPDRARLLRGSQLGGALPRGGSGLMAPAARCPPGYLVELRDDRHPGLVGIGEGFPDRFYGETSETMAAVLPLLLKAIGEPEPTPAGLIGADVAMASAIAHHGAAKCAVDIALHDLVGQITGQPVHRLLGLSADIPPTDFTIGIDEPAVVAERARRAARFPALKIKLGGQHDLATLEAVRGVFDGPIRVEATLDPPLVPKSRCLARVLHTTGAG